MKDKTLEMATKPINKLIFEYSLTTFTALLFSALYNTVDALFVSRGIGDAAMAGVSIVSPFMMLQGSFAQMIGLGAGTIISNHLGKKEYEKAGNTTLTAMFIFYLTTSTVSIICLIFSNQIITLLGATNETREYAKSYFTIIALGNVFSTGFSSIIRAEGKMKYALLIWLIPTGVNIAFDYILIFIIKLGVTGAAIATVMCQFTSFLMSLIFFTKISCQKFNAKKLNIHETCEVLTLGINALLQSAGLSIITFIINSILAKEYDYTYITSFSYISKIAQFAIVPLMAVSTAISPIISYNHSGKKIERVKKSIKVSLIYCYSFSIVELIILLIFSKRFIMIFTSNRVIINQCVNIINILSASLLFLPAILIISTYFQAIKNKKISFIITSSLLVIISALILFLKSKCIWMSIPVGCLVTLIISIYLYKKWLPNQTTFLY